jgi:RNA polymerase sigma-70 factor (ECF subfamily)
MSSKGKFQTTRWTVIRSARAKGDAGSDAALASLCEAYWYPLYVFVRRMGYSADDARDLTQDYFLKLLEKDFLDTVRPEAGKFRSFLLASMKHFLANSRRDAAAIKRGGGQKLLSLDLDGAEHRYRHELNSDESPEVAYERRWASAVIERARLRLRAEFERAGKAQTFELLAEHLTGGGPSKSHREIANRLDTTEAAIKMSVSRMRRQFGKALREEIADTIDENAKTTDIDAEVKYLLQRL